MRPELRPDEGLRVLLELFVRPVERRGLLHVGPRYANVILPLFRERPLETEPHSVSGFPLDSKTTGSFRACGKWANPCPVLYPRLTVNNVDPKGLMNPRRDPY